MRITILTPGFTSPNGRAFLFPLVVWRHEIRAAGIHVRVFTDISAPELDQCDVLMADSKFFSSRWAVDADATEGEIAALARRVKKLFWTDITDSSGWDHSRVLPHVTAWVKNQLLRDRSLYLKPIYGAGRLYADDYHRHHGVTDSAPVWSSPISDPALLNKLVVGWNSGLADYSLLGPARMALYHHLPWAPLLAFPRHWGDPAAPRDIAVSCRFGTSYGRASIAWQRLRVQEKMAGRLPTEKAGRHRYLRELERARIVVSPFGLGEITLKDFEVLRAGALLFKPSMTHLETWPDLFRDGETMAAHSWGLDDFLGSLDALLADPARCTAIARQGQDAYRRHLEGPDAAERFCTHFAALLRTGG